MTLDKYLGLEPSFGFIEKELYSRYQTIWRDLLSGRLIDTFDLEFKKRFATERYSQEFYNSNCRRTLPNALKHLESVGWRNEPYDKQHWGNWLHSLSPYQGRITPSFAHWLVKIFSKPNDTVLDPFMGVGTILLEADFLKRKAFGVDLNRYAWVVTKGKFERKSLQYYLDYLTDLKDLNTSDIDLGEIPDWIQAYYDPETLKEIVKLNALLQADEEWFLLGCLMGILHGNRPGYLSVYTGCIIPMTPRPVTHPKYRPDKDKPEYRAVIPRMAAKVMRMFSTGIPSHSRARIYHGDARALPLETDSVNVVISSPPYYNTLDYVGQNRVRLYFLGFDRNAQLELKKSHIQDSKTYLLEMAKVGKELQRVLLPKGLLVYVLGDVHRTKSSINTAMRVSEVYENLGFKQLSIVDDEIPLNKVASRSRRKKFDRVLVLKNP
ncbi:MAG: DNA methyltransferase [Candidatus Heimdallarchaeota archaeon]